MTTHLNQVQRTLNAVRKLSREDVQRQIGIVSTAISYLMTAGDEAGKAWIDLADTANMTETLAQMRIGGGDEAEQIVRDAQQALAYMRQERIERGTWALRAEERIEIRMRLELLRDLHRVQLSECSYGEFERAYRMTVERLRQARAGNAAAGTIVIEGVVS
jgi:aminoglycoside phosphotransferase